MLYFLPATLSYGSTETLSATVRRDRVEVDFSQSFNATTSDINLGAGTGGQAPTAQSILAYVRQDGAGEGTYGYLFAQTPSASANGPRFYLGSISGTYTVGMGSCPSAGGSNSPYLEKSGPNPTGKWVHAAGSWDGGLTASTAFKLYLGIGWSPLTELSTTYGSGNGSTAGGGSGNNIHIGNRQGTDRTFNGLIGYVARWNRVLSVEEFLRAQRLGPLSVPRGLIMLWANGRDYGPYHLSPTSTTAVTKAIAPPKPVLRTGRLLVAQEAPASATLSGAVTESGVDTATGSATYRHTASGSATESGADAATGSLAAVHTLAGAVTESSSDTATGAATFRHALAGAVVEASGDAATGAVAAVHQLAGAVTESSADTAAGTAGFRHVVTASAVETTADAASGALTYRHSISGAVSESSADTASGSASVGAGNFLTGSAVESSSDTASGTIAFRHAVSGAAVEPSSDVAAGALAAVHLLSGAAVELAADTAAGALAMAGPAQIAGAVAESQSDSAAGTLAFSAPATIGGSVLEAQADVAAGALLSSSRVTGAVVEGVGDTAAGSAQYQHYLVGAVVEALGDTAAGRIGKEPVYSEVAALGGIHTVPAIGADVTIAPATAAGIVRATVATGGTLRLRRHP